MNHKLFVSFIMVGLFLGFTLGTMNPTTRAIAEESYQLSCGSDSMGLTLGCRDVVFTDPPIDYILGDIYVFELKNITAVHRLVYCLDPECNEMIFKGDNNKVGEKVRKDQVVGKVKGVIYN